MSPSSKASEGRNVYKQIVTSTNQYKFVIFNKRAIHLTSLVTNNWAPQSIAIHIYLAPTATYSLA